MKRTLLLFFTVVCLWAQPSFEVASVKPADPKNRGMALDKLPGGRFIATNVSLRILLKEAYGMRDFQIEGAPQWFDSARWDVSAKSERAASDQEMTEMLQSLLAQRFALKLRQEERELQVYVLTAAKNGTKLKEAESGESTIGVRIRGFGHLTATKASMEQLAETLSDVRLNGRAMLDRPVLDRTGLKGVYDFTLAWTPDLEPADGAAPSETAGGPSIFTAVQEQLGLKLERQKAPLKVFIIDHVEKASQN
jgi:uncharacterized protein (TIGR03435 family)